MEQLSIGLPTGATPIPVYRRLFETGFAFPPGCRAFAVDEYRWPDATHPGTNAMFFRRYWPSYPGVPRVAVPRADAVDPDAEIDGYCAAIERSGGLDVVVLGIGANGHIAFNEPGSARDSSCRVIRLTERTRRAARGVWQQPPTEGLTIGIRQIMAAKQVILLATGASKRGALHAALTGPVTSDLPASFLQQHPSLTVVCDTEAWAT